LLFSVSRTRKNFSASIVVSSLGGCFSFLPKWIAGSSTNEAIASDFAVHAQRAILGLSQTGSFPHPYNYWGSLVSFVGVFNLSHPAWDLALIPPTAMPG